MWHEARRREKATQKLLSEHKKRAERRREENRIDPNSLLQIYGIKSKLCLDSGVYKQAVKSLVAWQGDPNVTIDRFDVRATLNSMPNETITTKSNKNSAARLTVLDASESESMKKILNYERYRLLIQNDLNKVPEELRLKLVAKSDVSSDAKMRKLRNNRFGTSGDASVSGNQMCPMNSKMVQFRVQVKRGASIGFNYNSVPPPSILNDSKRSETSRTQKNDDTNDDPQNSAMKIIDLEEFDNFDLDEVIILHSDSRRIKDTAGKYGLTSEEFILMAKRDGQELPIDDVTKELIQLSKKDQTACLYSNNQESVKQRNQVYGPDLPPELICIDQKLDQLSSHINSSSSSSHSSPIQQRSPSGANIPLRNGHENELERFYGTTDSILSVQNLEKNRQFSVAEDTNLISDQLIKDSKAIGSSQIPPKLIDSETPKLPSNHLNHAVDQESSLTCSPNRRRREQEIESKDNECGGNNRSGSRRASTPLVYKRNCRSSRSLSRERRSCHRSSHRRRRSKSRSRSRSNSKYKSRLRSSSRSSSQSSNLSGKLSRRKQRTSRSRRNGR